MASEITRRAAKAMGLFGSMQVVQVVCAMVRNMVISKWLGPVGLGLMGVYLTAVDLIGSVTQLGIRTSAVKEIASGDMAAVTVVRRFGVALGILGAVVAVVLSLPMSRWSFGDDSHVWSFCLLGAALLFQSLTNAGQAVFQGLSRLKPLASASLWGSVAGLALSVPLYRWLGLGGIAPSIVVYSVALWVPLAIHGRGLDRSAGRSLGLRQTVARGAEFMKVGFYLTLSSILGYLVSYVFLIFLDREGTEMTLGIYQAGYTMLWRYAAMIFVSVTYEYYPRLTRVSAFPRRMQAMVNHQSLFTALIMLPCVCFAIAASPLIVRVLYQSEFMPVLPYFTVGMAGMMFRPLSVAMSYSFLATGRGLTYSVTEMASSVVGLALNVAGFHWFGFAGLGVALIGWMGADVLIMYVFYRRMNLRINRRVALISAGMVALVLVCALLQLAGLWWAVAAAGAAALLPAVRFFRS